MSMDQEALKQLQWQSSVDEPELSTWQCTDVINSSTGSCLEGP